MALILHIEVGFGIKHLYNTKAGFTIMAEGKRLAMGIVSWVGEKNEEEVRWEIGAGGDNNRREKVRGS